jgi:hypothetical protein
MRSSAEDAIRLLNKWKSELASLRILFTTSGCELKFDGRILAVQDAMLLIEGPRPCQLWFSINATTFEYTEPRETRPVKARISAEITYVCTLSIRQPDGGLCLLNELRKPN